MKQNEFTIKALQQPFEAIRKHYENERKKEKTRIDNSSNTHEQKMALYGSLGRFKKMAKNEMIILFLNEHLDKLKKRDISQNMLLELCKILFKRQPNQNEPIFDNFNGKDISRREYRNKLNYTMDRVEQFDNFEALKRSLDY